MSNEALTAIAKSTIKPSGRKFVMMALADYADENWSCFPSVGQLSQYTDQGEKTVRDHLDALEQAGIITRVRDRRADGTLGRYRFFIQRRNLPVAKIARGEKPPKPPADFAAHNPQPNHQSKSSLRDDNARARFAEVWAVFPRRPGQSRKTALKAFLDLDQAAQAACLAGAKRYAALFDSERQARGETVERASRFVPALVRWIEDEGWTGFDEPEADDSDVVTIEPDTDDFAAVMRFMGDRVLVAKSGRLTIRKTELEQARAAK
ncbi:helix-turn-helix domain-containing protein [Devosia sp. Naph2]|uniref:helix-turn-helix domain-containing protein n=1 Tax=Devosia polycyclovorans TaxID=3345148 RepID=UPI0035CF6156